MISSGISVQAASNYSQFLFAVFNLLMPITIKIFSALMVATLILLGNLQEGVYISLRMDLKNTSEKIQKERILGLIPHHTNLTIFTAVLCKLDGFHYMLIHNS